MVTRALSSASTPTGGQLGKLVEAMALGFEMRDVPHCIKHMMQGDVRRWYNAKDRDDKKRKGSGQTLCHAVTERSMDCQTPPGQWAGESQVLELVEQQRQSGGRCLRADGRGAKTTTG